MFFVLSKLLYALIAPLSLVVIFLLLSAFTRKRKFFIAGLILLLVFTNPYLSIRLMHAWEVAPVSIPEGKRYDGIIVLGGFAVNTKVGDEQRICFSDGNDRMMQ